MKYPNSYLVLEQLTNYPLHSLTMHASVIKRIRTAVTRIWPLQDFLTTNDHHQSYYLERRICTSLLLCVWASVFQKKDARLVETWNMIQSNSNCNKTIRVRIFSSFLLRYPSAVFCRGKPIYTVMLVSRHFFHFRYQVLVSVDSTLAMQ